MPKSLWADPSLARLRGGGTKIGQVVIVSNRLPVHRVRRGNEQVWHTSPGGLVSALRPILQDGSSTWIGWAGVSGESLHPFEHGGIHQVPIPLSRSEVRDFYDGFANSTLWPLYHDAIRPPEFHRPWWKTYVEINRRFAEAASSVVSADGIVWIHDYHLQLAPAMLRQLRPDVRIGFFLHIPFPPQELFSQIPWRRQLLEGLLGSDVVGFQSDAGARNFVQLVRRYTSAAVEQNQITWNGRIVLARGFPISIDVAHFEQLAALPSVIQKAKEYARRLGPDRRILLGVDRLDYTKGIDTRLNAYLELLRAGRLKVDRCVLVQVAIPTRERVNDYRQQKESVQRIIGEINGEFGELGRVAVHYLYRSITPTELVALYRAAHVMVVTPYRDGMNLVAKEYVASRLDDSGVLILSEFTGAAAELSAAILVNPHDVDGLQESMLMALEMPAEQQAERMRAMRASVRHRDVYRWADEFLRVLVPSVS